jgi:hypothetical protein
MASHKPTGCLEFSGDLRLDLMFLISLVLSWSVLFVNTGSRAVKPFLFLVIIRADTTIGINLYTSHTQPSFDIPHLRAVLEQFWKD